MEEQAGNLAQAVGVFKLSQAERRGPDRARNVARLPGPARMAG